MKKLSSLVIVLLLIIIWQLYNHNHEHSHQHLHDEYVNKNYHSHDDFALKKGLSENHRHPSRLNGSYFEQQVRDYIKNYCKVTGDTDEDYLYNGKISC